MTLERGAAPDDQAGQRLFPALHRTTNELIGRALVLYNERAARWVGERKHIAPRRQGRLSWARDQVPQSPSQQAALMQ
jgi:hypothetical protein